MDMELSLTASGSGFQSVVLRPVAVTSAKNLLEI